MVKGDMIEFTHKYSIVPAKLTVLYLKGGKMEDLYKRAIVAFPILMSMEPPSDSYQACVFNNDNSSQIFMFIQDGISFSTIAHESVHVVSRIFDYMGSPITEATEEFFAYLLDYTFEQVAIHCQNTLKLKLKIV